MPITFDRSKPFSECCGDRLPDDPYYRVAFFQGGLLGKETVLLPFDAQGNLVPDDKKTEPWMGVDQDNKPVKYHPLWTPRMREYLAKKEKRIATLAERMETEDEEQAQLEETTESLSKDVNLVAYLTGDAKYEWPLVQSAARTRFGRVFTSKKQLVEDLVLDEKLITEEQLAADLVKYLPPKQAA